MKKITVLGFVAAVLVAFACESAHAIPLFLKAYAAKYDSADYAATIKESKCGVCHYGKSKKNRNDYGVAMDAIVDKADFKGVKTVEGAAKTSLFEAMEKLESEDAKAGGTFGDLIKAGKLPGTAPE